MITLQLLLVYALLLLVPLALGGSLRLLVLLLDLIVKLLEFIAEKSLPVAERRQYELEDKLDALNRQLKQEELTIQEWSALLHKMETTNDLYAPHIEVVNKELEILKKSTALTRKLYEGNKQLKQMLEIERTTSRLTEQLPDEYSSAMVQKIHELEEIEEQKMTLALSVNPQALIEHPSAIATFIKA